MSTKLLSVAREDSFGEAARRMVERDVMGALVDPEGDESAPGIVTASDVLELVAEADDPASTTVSEHFTERATAAAPDWSLDRAAEAMLEGRFRHLVVADAAETLGVISIRDIVRAWTAGRPWRRPIQIREAGSPGFLRLSGDETVQEAAQRMVDGHVGAAIVERTPGARPEIITERDVLATVAQGASPQTERVADHLSERMTYSAPDWSLKQSAEAMIQGGFQHVVVVDRDATLGILSMRDVLARWLV